MSTSLSKAHKAEILKRLLKKQSPAETNMGEQTPPNMGMMGMPPGIAPPQLPGMEIGQGMMPMAPQSNTPPIELDQTESFDQNPIAGLGNQLFQQLEPELQTTPEKTTFTPIETIIKNEAEASQIWKVMGGYDSTVGRYWQELANKSDIYDSGRDYFVSCYNKYLQNPEKFSKTNQKEAMLIKNINKIMEE